MSVSASRIAPYGTKLMVSMDGVENTQPCPYGRVPPWFFHDSVLGHAIRRILVVGFVCAHAVGAKVLDHVGVVSQTRMGLRSKKPALKKLRKNG